jgi:hypothetical protein
MKPRLDFIRAEVEANGFFRGHRVFFLFQGYLVQGNISFESGFHYSGFLQRASILVEDWALLVYERIASFRFALLCMKG